MATTKLQHILQKPHTVAMSSGFFGFFAHCGFVHALEEAGFRPKKITGSSAGALIGGLWASGVDMHRVAERLRGLRRQDFWDPGFGIGLLRGRKMDALLESMLGSKRIEECNIPLAISIWDPITRRTTIQRTGRLATAIRASCAVPLMFHPVWIGKRPLLDGGIGDRPGMASCTDDECVLYHHLLPRSVWRSKAEGAYRPTQNRTLTIAAPDLPRLNPFSLSKAHLAIELARAHTARELRKPI